MNGASTNPILLFDVMETLVSEPFRAEIPAFFGMTSAELRGVLHPTAWVDFELGRSSEAEYLRNFFADGRQVDGAGLRAMVANAYGWLDGMEALLAELQSAGHPMHALSNYPIWYRLVDESLDLSRYLSWTFVSCDTGLRKPDPRAFVNAATRLGVAASDCLFIDDRTLNVDAAKGVGMDAIVFRGAASCRAALAKRGLLGT